MRLDEPRMAQMFFQRAQNGVEAFDVSHLEDEAASRGQFSELGSLCSVVGDRFLYQHMFAFGEKCAGNLVVRIGGRCYGSGVNHSDEIIERFGGRSPEFARNRAAPERLQVVHCGELSRRNFRVKSCMITSDMPNTNNANAKLFHRSSMSQLRKLSRVNALTFQRQQFATNHSYVCAMPLRNGIVGCQPSARIFVASNSFRGVPSGLVLSQTSSPSNPTRSQINLASSPIVMSSPQPTLMISGESYFCSSNSSAA